MATTRVVVTNRELKEYLFRNYLSAEKVFKYLGVDVVGKNNSDKSTGQVSGFPEKYIVKLNAILKNNTKVILFAGQELYFEINSTKIKDFFNGKMPGLKNMYFVENGSKPSGKYFFFSVNQQRKYADMVNAVPGTNVPYKRKNFSKRPSDLQKEKKERYEKRKVMRAASRKKRKQFEVIAGKSGKGVMARWENFHKGGQSILKAIYRGRPYWPGFNGLNIRFKVIEYYGDTAVKRKINKDKVVIDYIRELYAFDISKADIDFDEFDIQENVQTLKGSAKIEKQEREIIAERRGPVYTVYEAVKNAILDLFK